MSAQGEEQERWETLERAVLWLFVVLAATLLSFLATLRQREGARLRLEGREEDAQRCEAVLGLRRLVARLLVPALSWFFLAAARAEEQAQQGGESEALRSARLNRWAAGFGLLAAGLRLVDVERQYGANAEQRRESYDRSGTAGANHPV